jgi:hypothetical protein
VHVTALYALTRIPVPVSEARTPAPAVTSVVWLRELPAPVREREAVEPPPPAAVEPSSEPATPPAPKRAARRKQSAEPVPPPPVQPEAPAQTTPPPRIDWDKERRAAVRETVENPRGPYRTFTPEDLPERKPDPLPIEPAPKAMAKVMSSRCVIFKNRFQAALLGMVGVCTRDAEDGLFAGVRPPRMDEHPVCRETRPDSPGAVASDGRLISTMKCELVADDGDVTEVKVEVDLDAPP